MAQDVAAVPESPAPVALPKTPEAIERDWLANVYAGDRMRQLTVRAVVMGMLLGGVMATSNVYVSLKSGWSLGVAITSCVLAYTIFAGLHRALPRLFPPFTILENATMQAAATAAGTMTSAGLSNAIPALQMLNPGLLPADWTHRMLWLIPWCILLSWLGVFIAVPAKRQMINVEQLPFPTGTAAAATLRSLHAHGREAASQAKTLFLALGFGGLLAWIRGAEAPWIVKTPIAWMPKWSLFNEWSAPKWAPWLRVPKLHDTWGTNAIQLGTWQGKPLLLSQLTLSFEGSLLFVASGAIISFRQAWSMLLGAVINYGLLAPHFLASGDIAEPSFRRISSWSLWIGVPMMVTSGLLLFFMNWRSVVRAFSSVSAFFSKRTGVDPLEKVEVPGAWFLFGFTALGVALILLGHALFGIRYWMGAIAVLATFFLVVVAARAAGESDITPVGPISKITQLTFGLIAPGNVGVNLMTADITGGASSHAADLLQDLKSGYLLGANPRQQFLAQFFGVLAGGLVVVPVYFILIPTPAVLGTEAWPAPAALVWRGVAELLSKGITSLPMSARYGLVIGGSIGIILPLLERAFPKQKAFIPSPTGLGLAFTINGFNSISFFLGSLAALIFRKARPAAAARYTVPAASGVIAGESLMGVSIAFLRIFHVLS